MPPARRALPRLLLAAAVLAGLVALRWTAPGAPGGRRPAGAPGRPAPAAPLTPPGTRLSLGGRQPVVVDPADGTVARLAVDPHDRTTVFRHGAWTVLVAGGRAWSVPAGRTGPRRPLGPAVAALPAPAADRVWLLQVRDGPPQAYRLVQVGLADGRRVARRTLSYQATPVAVLPSGVLARTLADDLELLGPDGRVRAVLGRPASFVDAAGDQVAFLAGGRLHLRDLATGAGAVVPPPAGSAGWQALGAPVARAGCCYALGAFAPDGRTLAVYARVAGPRAPGLAVVDPASGRAALLPGSEGATPSGHLPSLAWGSDGWLFFLAAGDGLPSVGAWRPGEPAAGRLRLDVGRALDALPDTLAAN